MSSVPEKRARHRSQRNEITKLDIARTVYNRRPDHDATGKAVHWTAARSFALPNWICACRQAGDIYRMFMPFRPLHENRSLPMFEKCVSNGITEHSWEEIDGAIQVAIEQMSEEFGKPVTTDLESSWAEVEDRVLQMLDISGGDYWKAEIG